MSFGLPWALVGLFALPLLWLAGARSRYHLSGRRRSLALASRAAAVALLVLAVADLRAGWPTDRLAVAVVVDRTPGISATERGALEQTLAALRAQHPEVQWLDVPADSPASDLGTALAALPRDRVKRVLFATDGRDGSERVRTALSDLRASGAEVSVEPLGDAPPIDLVSVAQVDVPRLVRAGERVDVGVSLFASSAARAEVELQLDGRSVARETIDVRAGVNARGIALDVPRDEGVHTLDVEIRAQGDTLDSNNHHRALVRVVSPPRVLLVHALEGNEPALATVLRDAGLRVDAVRAPQAPDAAARIEPYALAILDELDETTLTEAQQRTLRGWVERRGGGLLTITGTHAVRRDPDVLRAIEPVGPPPAIPEPRPLELVLVIDRSSSMDGRPMSEARRAGISGVGALREDALCGVVAFSDGADRTRSPTPVATDRGAIQGFIAGIQSNGGTDIGAALWAASAMMSRDPRYIHHVILLSDGESDPAPALAAAARMAADGITITTITLGPRSQLMAQIARTGHGRYHVTNSPGSLPSLFVREAQFRQPPANKEIPFVPRVERASRLLEDVDVTGAPTLGGWALAETRRGADQILATPDGPLLSHWYQGLGQVATFTSATSGGWADGWRAWPQFRAFWASVTKALLRERQTEPLSLRISRDPRAPALRTLTVLAPYVQTEPAPIARLSRGAAPVELELTSRGPGVWQTELPLEDGFLVEARLPGDIDPSAAAAADATYDERLARFGADRDALAQWAQLGGGAVLADPAEIVESVESELVERSLRTPLLAAALAFYLLGILLLRLPDRAVAAPVAKRARKATTLDAPARKEAA